ncbi:unnamed protein product [Camellia sinensis]
MIKRRLRLRWRWIDSSRFDQKRLIRKHALGHRVRVQYAIHAVDGETIIQVEIRLADLDGGDWFLGSGDGEIAVEALGDEEAAIDFPGTEFVGVGEGGEVVPGEGLFEGVGEEEGDGGAGRRRAAIVVEFGGGGGECEVGWGEDGAGTIPRVGTGGGRGDKGSEQVVAAGFEDLGGREGGGGWRSGGGGRSQGEEAEEGEEPELEPELEDCHFVL